MVVSLGLALGLVFNFSILACKSCIADFGLGLAKTKHGLGLGLNHAIARPRPRLIFTTCNGK